MIVEALNYTHDLPPNTGIGPVSRTSGSRYLGTPMDTRRTRAYGGSLMAQALLAAMNEVGTENRPRSLTMAFFKSSDGSTAMDFALQQCAKTRTIATYQVTGTVKSSPACAGQISLDLGSPSSDPMTARTRVFDYAKSPEEAKESSLWPSVTPKIAERLQRFESRHAWEVRFGTPPPIEVDSYPVLNVLWVRPLLEGSAAQWTGDLLLAHGSDFYVPAVAAATRGGFLADGWKATTITHSIWFLASYEPGSWIRVKQFVEMGASDRVLVDQELTDGNGVILARAVQEALVRQISPDRAERG